MSGFAAVFLMLSCAAAAAENTGTGSIAERSADLAQASADFGVYLDRLMMAESDGRDFLKNPRSSALGPFQFIKGTFLYVVRRRFQSRIGGMSESEVLALRTNRAFAREVMAEYSRELASHLGRHGLETTYGNLRLAYLIGPSGATSVLSAEADTPLNQLISAEAIAANPFMAGMTARDIIRRAHNDIAMDRSKRLAVAGRRQAAPEGSGGEPKIRIRCNPSRPSCRRWVALRKKKLRREIAAKEAGGPGGNARR
ncbi:MAG: hypothetical protein KJ622_18020 [Alphaproteobacteria bacterium]|nr:hypothetical protein [Alphaproteobacteria bacterium]